MNRRNTFKEQHEVQNLQRTVRCTQNLWIEGAFCKGPKDILGGSRLLEEEESVRRAELL